MRTKARLGTALFAALLAMGCEQSCPDGSDGDVDAGTTTDGAIDGDQDGAPPLDCTVPEVECPEGEHAEYGLCIEDDQEVTIPGGSFDMGGDDLPVHGVTLSEFTIDRTEVSNERYRACVAAGCCTRPSYDGSYSGREPYYGNDTFNRFPVIFVSWQQARQYCEGQGKRLPTEAEWEYAARGDDGRIYPWGDEDPNSRVANYFPMGVDATRVGDTESVESFSDGASPFGLLNMAGNVWEWVADWYSASYYDDSPGTDPAGPEDGVTKVARGGSFASSGFEIFTYYRTNFLPAETYSTVGFRCAR